MKESDIEFRDHGLWTRFYPKTKEGESVWREMAKEDGIAAVLSMHKSAVIAQIRKAGYSVTKAKLVNMTINDVLKELEVL